MRKKNAIRQKYNQNDRSSMSSIRYFLFKQCMVRWPKEIGQFIETYLRGANNFPQIDIHPCVATDQMTVVCFAIFQFHQLIFGKESTLFTYLIQLRGEFGAREIFDCFTYHWMALGGFQQR